jgi:hypothetical protein
MKFNKAIVFILIQTACFGQTTASSSLSLTLPNIAFIAIAPDNFSVDLVGVVSSAGSPITISNNTFKWINFTSSVAANSYRTITAQITSGSIPNGVALKLTISPASGGMGTLGTNLSPIILTNSPQPIIQNIGGAYTGQGNNGYNLKYEFIILDYSQLRAGNTSISILFTIT